MGYVFGEILVWLLIAVVATAVLCWLLWRWRVNRIPYEEWAAMEMRASSPVQPAIASQDHEELDQLRASVAQAETDRAELEAALAATRRDLDDAQRALDTPAEVSVEAETRTDADLALELSAARAEMEKAARRAGELSAALDAERKRNEELAAATAVHDGPDEVEPSLAAATSALRAEIDELQTALEQSRADATAARSALDASEAAGYADGDDSEAVASLRTEVQTLTEAAMARDAELTDVRTENERLSDELLAAQRLEQAVAERDLELAEVRSTVDQMTSELDEARALAPQLDAARANAGDQAAELLTVKQQLEAAEAEAAETKAAAQRDLELRDAELAAADSRLVEAERRHSAVLLDVEQLKRELEASAEARSPFDAEALARREERLVADLDATAIRVKQLEMALAEALRNASAPAVAPEAPADATTSSMEQARLWSVEPPERSKWDDLTEISGVGPKLASMLQSNGIYTFAQVAALTDSEVDELQEQLPEFPGRIRRDGWVEQAQRLLA